MNLSDNWKELLILEVSKYPFIYDVTKEAYRNKYIRQNAWEIPSQVCGCLVEGIAMNYIGLRF